jgi:hypothetical protein
MPVRKMALMPFDAVQRLSELELQKPENKDPNLQALNKLEGQMIDTLEANKMSNEEKLALYQNLFHRYGNIDRQQRQETSPQPTLVTRPSIDQLTEYIPKNQKMKGKILLDFLNNNPDVKWTDRGQVVVKGEVVEDSNMVDVFRELLRDRSLKGQPPVKGAVELARVLAENNIPRDAISNKDIRSLVFDFKQKQKHQQFGAYFDDDDTDDDFRTPKQRIKTRSKAKKLLQTPSTTQSGRGLLSRKIKWKKY